MHLGQLDGHGCFLPICSCFLHCLAPLYLGKGGEFKGYTDPKATEKKLMKDVFVKGDCWFRTGDLLKVDAQGYFYFIDRIGDTFRWRGENVSTTEVAGVLSLFKGLDEVNVYGVSISGYEGRTGMASVIIRDLSSFSWNDLYEYLEKNLPVFARPLFIRVQQEMQKTSTFKHTKTELVKQGFNPHEISDPLFFRDDKNRSYIPLTSSLYHEILQGKVHFK